MTQESINDLVRNAANQLTNIWGNVVLETGYSLASTYNLSTGKWTSIPRRKPSKPTTLSESFTRIYNPTLQRIYTEQVLPFINTDFAELLIKGAKNARKHYLKETEKNRLRILEIRYEIHTKSNDELDIEELEAEIRRCRLDQIKEQLYADFYKLVISDLTTKETPKKPQLKSNTAAFYLSIYVLGQLELGVIDKFPLYGSSDNITKEKVTRAAKWAMQSPMFNRTVNINTLHSYLRDPRVKFTKHLPNVEEFLCSYYPNRETEIKSILIEVGKKFKENNQ
jgi:hypothetical protein